MPAVFLFLFLIFFVLLLATGVSHMILGVPYVPTKTRVAALMVKAAGLRGKETVLDLGCGDGRLLFESEKKQRHAGTLIGFEAAPLVYLLAQLQKFFRRSRAVIFFKNFFHADFHDADVIFCYLFPGIMPRLAAKIQAECRPGTKIISNTFHIPGLPTPRVIKKDKRRGTPTLYIYTLKRHAPRMQTA